MKILVTFEHGGLPIYAVDVFRLLKYRGHDVSLLILGTNALVDPNDEIRNSVKLLGELPPTDQFDVWMYDASTWETAQSPFIGAMTAFRGKLVCINFEDEYHFFLTHLTNHVIEKTCLYINNALYKDKERYDVRIRDKIMLAPSYIGNSQAFKNLVVPFAEKKKRAIFTGNITGLTESGDPEELKCRINVPMALINGNVPCYYRIYSSDPNYKKVFDEVPSEYKCTHLDWSEFLQETVNSMIVLSLRGNGHTVRRYFEGLASNGLVFTTKSDHMVEFIGQGKNGEHFIEIDWSGKDVVEKANYYLNHPEESETIANAGRKLWEETSMLDEKFQLPSKISEQIISNARRISGIEF